MDYEVFLLSRVREEWRRTGDSRTSVADGLAATAKVITAAAAIMVVVFGSFMLEFERTMKMMGLGLATAILLDATIVRMVLVPGTMEPLGDRNCGRRAGSIGSCPTSTSKATTRRMRKTTSPAWTGRRTRPRACPRLGVGSEPSAGWSRTVVAVELGGRARSRRRKVITAITATRAA